MDLSEVVRLKMGGSPEPDTSPLMNWPEEDSVKWAEKERTALFKELTDTVLNKRWRKLQSLVDRQEYKDVFDCRNELGETILHIAADISEAEGCKILLEAGAEPNPVDNNGRIPLHLVLDGGCRCQDCTKKNEDCVKALLERGSLLDAEDKDKETPLQYAANYMMPNCATVLLDWGADINRKSKKNIGVLIVEKVPEVMTGELDKGILFGEKDTSKLKLDFKVILQRSDSDKEEISKTRKEMNLLNYFLKAHKVGREALLTHPLTEAFLYLKWAAVDKWFWIIRILYYLLAMLYTVFIFNVFLINCEFDLENSPEEPNTTDSVEGTTLFDSTDTTESPDDDEKNYVECEPTTAMYVMASVMTLGVVCMMLNEFYEMSQEKKGYFRIGLNYAWWILIVCVGITILPAYGYNPRYWHYPIAAFGIFYAWGMTLVQVGRIPRVGVYVEMLGKVLKDFAIFLATYFSLLLGFALGFCVLFPHHEMFEYVPLALMKVLLIMIGESDYEGLLLEEENERVGYLGYSIPAHIIFAGFIIVVTIVLMNLLLGLAVSDIQELQKTADILRVTRQIQQISLFESLIYSKMLPRGLSVWAINHFSIIRLAEHQGNLFEFSPTDPEDKKLPETLKGKFIPFLTKSPCLDRKKRRRGLLASRIRGLKAFGASTNVGAGAGDQDGFPSATTPGSTNVEAELPQSSADQLQLLQALQATVLALQRKLDENSLQSGHMQKRLEEISSKLDDR